MIAAAVKWAQIHTRAVRREFTAYLKAETASARTETERVTRLRAAIRSWRGTRGQGPDFLDIDPFESALIAAHAMGLGSRMTGEGAGPTLFADPAGQPPDLSARVWYADALGRFAKKAVINGEQMQNILDRVPAAVARRGNAPERQQVHNAAFTMIREGNQKIIENVAQVFERTIRQGTAGDFFHDINDVYASAGIADQQPWYTDLVYTNNMNRAYQEGLDAMAAELDKDGDLWGYEWIHSGAKHPRPAHIALNGWAAPKDDARWAQIGVPPVGHGCGCQRLPVTRREAEDRGLRSDPATPRIPRNAEGMPKGYAGGLDAIQGLDLIPGERFGRGQYNIPNRPIFNPSWGLDMP